MRGPTRSPGPLGDWTLVEPLGAGGMGEVWRAESSAGQVAAIKILARSDAEGQRRFEREIQAIMTLLHPNVVQAFAYGQAKDGAPYLAMELLHGKTLDEILRTRAVLPMGEALTMAQQAAEGLAAAHAHGIVHRDVKPGNLFIQKGGVVKVLDFGLALHLGEKPESGPFATTRITRTGTVLGTPSYMAPEQAMAERQEDTRTDVWALAAVLRHALEGAPPFWSGGNLIAELFQIVSEQPRPMPESTPPSLVRLLDQMLEKDARLRPQTMREVAVTLERIVAKLADQRSAFLAPSGTRAAVGDAPTQRQPPVLLTTRLVDEARLVAAVVAEGVKPQSIERFRAEAAARGGALTALRGGRAVLVFGGAEWTGDEAERAVRTALVLRSNAARFGVGTGKAIRAGSGAVTGDVLVAAEQAMRSAASGEREGSEATVGVCDETARRIYGGFRIRDGQVDEECPGLSTIGIAEVGGVEIPMLGRDLELSVLCEEIATARDESSASSVLVLGPPGIGKSRLRVELQRWLERETQHYRYLQGRGEPHRTLSSYATIQSLLRSRAGIPEGTAGADALQRLSAMVDDASVPEQRRRGTIDFLAELLGIPVPENEHLRTARRDPRAMADRIRVAVGDLVDAWSAEAPVILALEDLQWADGASINLLELLLLRLAHRPVVVIAFARPEVLSRPTDVLPEGRRLELRELKGRHVAQLVERILGRPDRLVADRAGGNPYFAEELALAVREGAAPDELPTTVEGAVQARLDQLAPEQKDLVKRAAVLGRSFWVEALQAMGQEDAPRHIAGLRRRDLVIPHPRAKLADCTEWAFRHVVVRDVAFGMLTPEQRRGLHSAAADWLSGRADAPPEEVAAHLQAADLLAEARGWWLRATGEAHRRGDSEQVLALSERVLRLDPSGTGLPMEDLYRLRLRRAESKDWLGRVDTDEDFRELRRLEAAAGTRQAIAPSLRAEMRGLESLHLSRVGDWKRSAEVADEAIRHADEHGEAAIWIRVQARRAITLAEGSQYEEAFAAAARTRERLAEAPEMEGVTAFALGYAAYQSGDMVRALPAFITAADAFEHTGQIRQAALSRFNQSSCLTSLGVVGQARETTRRAVEETQSLGLARTEVLARANGGLLAGWAGEFQEAEETFARARTLNETMQVPAVAGGLHGYRAETLLRSGRSEAAVESARRAVECARVSPRPGQRAYAHAILAAALLSQGRLQEAEAECELALEAADRPLAMGAMEYQLPVTRYDVLVALGRSDEALVVARQARVALDEVAARIDDPELRQAFVQNVPTRARLVALTSAAG